MRSRGRPLWRLGRIIPRERKPEVVFDRVASGPPDKDRRHGVGRSGPQDLLDALTYVLRKALHLVDRDVARLDASDTFLLLLRRIEPDDIENTAVFEPRLIAPHDLERQRELPPEPIEHLVAKDTRRTILREPDIDTLAVREQQAAGAGGYTKRRRLRPPSLAEESLARARIPHKRALPWHLARRRINECACVARI